MTETTRPAKGSFACHLALSSIFVRKIAFAIQFAGPVNIELLRIAYPQMVAAYEMTDWSQAPPGFEPIYNAQRNAQRKESEE